MVVTIVNKSFTVYDTLCYGNSTFLAEKSLGIAILQLCSPFVDCLISNDPNSIDKTSENGLNRQAESTEFLNGRWRPTPRVPPLLDFYRNPRLFSSLRSEEPTHTYGESNTAQSSPSVIVLPNTGLLRMPEYSCFIPEHGLPQRGTSRVSLLASWFRINCFIPERIFQRLGQL